MKIYISLPITGHDIEDVEADCIFASGVISKKGHTPVNPLEIYHGDPENYEAAIGTDITALLCCDAVLFMPDWQTSKGCRLEQAAAKIYGKQMYFDFDKIPENAELWHVMTK